MSDAPMSHVASVALLAFLATLVAGCGPPERRTTADGTWVGTIVTEGNVTTVVNESGSVWGGTATPHSEIHRQRTTTPRVKIGTRCW